MTRNGSTGSPNNAPTIRSLTYNDANELVNESYSGGTSSGLSVTNQGHPVAYETNLVLGITLADYCNNGARLSGTVLLSSPNQVF